MLPSVMVLHSRGKCVMCMFFLGDSVLGQCILWWPLCEAGAPRHSSTLAKLSVLTNLHVVATELCGEWASGVSWCGCDIFFLNLYFCQSKLPLLFGWGFQA